MTDRVSGVTLAVVVDTKDPQSKGRVRIEIPSQPQSPVEWARVVAAPVGGQLGPIRLKVNDEVLVAFQQGDVRQPFVIGVLWDGAPPPAQRNAEAVRLPTGSVLKGIYEPQGGDVLDNIFELLSAYLAAVECQNNILRLLKPLIEVVKELPSPSAASLAQFTASADELAPCLFAFTPAGVRPFIQDLLCLTLRSVQLLLDQPISESEKAAAIASIQGVLDAARPYFDLTGILPITLLATGSAADLEKDIAALQLATDALGGCTR